MCNGCVTRTKRFRLTPRSSPSWEADSFAASQNICCILQNPQFATSRHLSIPSATLAQSTPRIRSYEWLFPSGFPTKTHHAVPISPIRATSPANPVLPDLITLIISGKKCVSRSSSLCNFLQSPLATALSDPTNLTQYALLQRDQVSHPYKTTSQITWMFILYTLRQ
jgi:hypothetical protein